MCASQNLLDKPFLTPAEVMELTGMAKTTAYKKIHEEIGYYEFSPRRLSVKPSDLLKWMETKKVEPSDQR